MIEVVETQEEIENLYKSGGNAPYQKLDEPFFGYLGVLLANRITGKVQCHICGEWKNSISHHVSMKHKIPVKEYKSRFGFPENFPLCSKRVSENHSKACLKGKPWEKSMVNKKIQILTKKYTIKE